MSEILVGTAGWSYKDWEGIVYPAQLKKRQHPVEYLAQFVDTIEINSSFYGHIKPEWGKLWCHKAAAVNRAFMFTAKLNKAFTHSPIAAIESTSAATIQPEDEDERLARMGLDSIAEEGRLGALLIQFPISFKNTSENRDYLELLLRRFIEYPRVVEVRHASWNNEGTLRYFLQKNVAFCNIDQPRIGEAIGPTTHVTAPLAYVRLHGRNYQQWFEHEQAHERYDYLYKPEELQGWKRRIQEVASQAEKTYVVANNHFEGKAAVNAIELKRMLGQPARAPETLVRRYPELKQFAEIVPEQALA